MLEMFFSVDYGRKAQFPLSLFKYPGATFCDELKCSNSRLGWFLALS